MQILIAKPRGFPDPAPKKKQLLLLAGSCFLCFKAADGIFYHAEDFSTGPL